MTVSYIHRGTPSIWRRISPTFFLFWTNWRGSIVKGIGPQFGCFLLLFGAISTFYRNVLVDSLGDPILEGRKQWFEKMCVKCYQGAAILPLDFILGFFVTWVVNRWWAQYQALHWDNTLALNLVGILPGPGRMERLRNQFVRLVNLSNILLLRGPSPRVLSRFPDMASLESSGLMTAAEVQLYTRQENELKKKYSNNQKLQPEDNYLLAQLPIRWATNLAVKLKGEEEFSSDLAFRTLQSDLNGISLQQTKLLGYIEVTVPLVYTQLVVLAVHIYFAVALFGQQFLNPTKHIKAVGRWTAVEDDHAGDTENLVGYDDGREDIYVPVFTLLKFVFYFGWLHVATVLIDPFGNDDEDFDLNMMINRNLETGFMIVKEPVEEEVMEDTPEEQAKLKEAIENYYNGNQKSDKPKWPEAIKKLLHVKPENVEPDQSSLLESVAVENNDGNNNGDTTSPDPSLPSPALPTPLPPYHQTGSLPAPPPFSSQPSDRINPPSEQSFPGTQTPPSPSSSSEDPCTLSLQPLLTPHLKTQPGPRPRKNIDRRKSHDV